MNTEEEKPRYQRILDRMSKLVDEYIGRVSIGGEGGVTVQNNGKNYLLSSSNKGKIAQRQEEDVVLVQNIPLEVLLGRVYVNIGPLDGVVATLSGSPIYGDGSLNSRPSFSDSDADIWVNINITPTSIWQSRLAPVEYSVGNLTVNSAEVVALTIDTPPSYVEATLDISSGAASAGTYPLWIGRMVGGEAFTSEAFYQTTGIYDPNAGSFFKPSLAGVAMGGNEFDIYFTYTAAVYEPGVGITSEAIAYL